MRVAIYATDEQEEPETQLPQLRAWCAAGGHEIVGEYIDRGVAASILEAQPPARRRFNALLDEAQQRRFDLVLAWSLWQFSREGFGTADILKRLAAAGVAFHSYTEPLLSTDSGLVRDVLLAATTSLVRQERMRQSERTKAGMARARARGKRIGAARIPAAKESAIRAALAAGDKGMGKIARELRVATGTVFRVAHEAEAGVKDAGVAAPPVARGPVWR